MVPSLITHPPWPPPPSWIDKGVLGLNGVIGCFGMTEVRIDPDCSGYIRGPRNLQAPSLLVLCSSPPAFQLAHGSNVAGIETTATFDPQSDEFIIHTPHLYATKWWIGGAASTATHCAVFAQLVIDGKKHGVKTFVVQLRDTKCVLSVFCLYFLSSFRIGDPLRHFADLSACSRLGLTRSFMLLPGVNIGDLGKKMGRDGIDNGYIQFTYVRVPRSHMLMKHTQCVSLTRPCSPSPSSLFTADESNAD